MVRHQLIGLTNDPRHIADAHLTARCQRRRHPQPRGIPKRPCLIRKMLHRLELRYPLTNLLGMRQIETEQLAPVVVHSDILINVSLCVQAVPHRRGPP